MELLRTFFKAIENDPRIGASHISVYCTLLQLADNNMQEPVLFRSSEVMRLAKISGLGTYHRCIKNLHEFGYLEYMPCYNHRKKNKAYLKMPKTIPENSWNLSANKR